MNKVALRNTLKKLRAVPLDRAEHANVMMAPQEMLDFLAMLAGIKPVCLLGRGFDDPRWIAGVTVIAKQMGLHVIEGPHWDAAPANAQVPGWFRAHMDAQDDDRTAIYVCRARGVADAVQATIDNPPIAIEEEARLLGYPVCCVKAHYERQALFHQAFYMMLQRTGGGDIAEMQRILREDIGMHPETPEEEATLKQGIEFIPAPFTSLHMCAVCAADPSGPATETARRYEALAHTVDERLAAEIAANQQGVGRYS